jgi:5-methylcytosine-specific restriction protein B
MNSPSTVHSTLIDRYKRKVADIGLGNEAYKWEWIQTYKGRPDLDAEDLVAEIKVVTRTNLIYHISSSPEPTLFIRFHRRSW